MKLVDWKTFMALPIGTVYRLYKRNYELDDDLCIKGETSEPLEPTLTGDFWVQHLTFPQTGDDQTQYATFDAFDKGAEIRIDYNVESRHGSFDSKQMFAVYDNVDINVLIERLRKAQIDVLSTSGAWFGSEEATT